MEVKDIHEGVIMQSCAFSNVVGALIATKKGFLVTVKYYDSNSLYEEEFSDLMNAKKAFKEAIASNWAAAPQSNWSS